MTTSYQANQIRAQKRKLWCMQVAELQKQQESHDPWYSSPVNILNMPLSSTQISLAPFDLSDLAATSPITKLHMDLLRCCPQSRWLAEDEPFFPNDLAADREAKWLGLSNAPSRWQGGNDAWILWTQYIPIITDRCSARPNVDVILKTHLPVTIRTLPRDDQCIAYHQLHKTATPAQLTAYYALHCEQLDSARCCITREKLESMKEPKHTSPACLFYRLDQAMAMTRGVRLPHRLERYYQAQRALLTDAEYRLRKRFKARAEDRAFARGLEQLIEECETLLRRTSEKFTAIDWRPFTNRKRWQDGERGWTGLREEDVRGDIVKVGGRDVSSQMVSSWDAKMVCRAQFARDFPRGVDKRIGAGEGEKGKGVRNVEPSSIGGAI